MPNIVNGLGQVKVGVRIASGGGGGIDTDAQAFITAANITDTTQQNAIITLVTQLKTYGIWTKLKAVYPFVGGTANSHKFNLKDPRDLDAAYRLVFNGGWTHSSTGALPNGSTGYADTKLIPTSVFTDFNNVGVSNYQVNSFEGYNEGAYTSAGRFLYGSSTTAVDVRLNTGTDAPFTANYSSDGKGLFTASKVSSTYVDLYRSGVLITSVNKSSSSVNVSLALGARNGGGVIDSFFSVEKRFTAFHMGLTAAEVANLYTAVQKYQSTLGRNVGVPIVADTDAQAFLNAAVITDTTQASAINTLVTDLKTANIWTKMKALYPFVGGTATTHKYNLKDPRDLDAAFRLQFNGGWTHSSTGALPNGTTGYANTYFNPSTNLSIDNTHMSYYSRTNNARDSYDMGLTTTTTSPLRSMHAALKWSDSSTCWSMGFQNPTTSSSEVCVTLSSTRANFLFNKTSSTSTSLFANNTKYTASVTNRSLPSGNFYLGARNLNGGVETFTNRESAFASIGDGLTDAEAAAFYTAVQAYQTTLGRQV